MREIEAPFEIQLNGVRISISEHELQGKRAFHADLGKDKKPLVLTVGLSNRNEKFWNSIPQGRQEEAQQIGKLIGEYIHKKEYPELPAIKQEFINQEVLDLITGQSSCFRRSVHQLQLLWHLFHHCQNLL